MQPSIEGGRIEPNPYYINRFQDACIGTNCQEELKTHRHDQRGRIKVPVPEGKRQQEAMVQNTAQCAGTAVPKPAQVNESHEIN